MKKLPLLLLAACQVSFGQTDTNVLAIGDWSAPVATTIGANAFGKLHGRLLVYDAVHTEEPDVPTGRISYDPNDTGVWAHGKIYLELQNLDGYFNPPLEFYFDRDKSCLHFEMRDGHDRPIALDRCGYTGFAPRPFTITLPPDSTIRVRVDFECESLAKPGGLVLQISPTRFWDIRSDSTNEYYLSATFSPPTNQPSDQNNGVWQGTLQLPKVKIPVEKIRK